MCCDDVGPTADSVLTLPQEWLPQYGDNGRNESSGWGPDRHDRDVLALNCRMHEECSVRLIARFSSTSEGWFVLRSGAHSTQARSCTLVRQAPEHGGDAHNRCWLAGVQGLHFIVSHERMTGSLL